MNVRMKVSVMDDTDHCCWGVGGIVDAVYLLCIYCINNIITTEKGESFSFHFVFVPRISINIEHKNFYTIQVLYL